MKRFAVIFFLALALTGCASMWKAMGVATESSVAARDDKINAQLSDLKSAVDDLSSKTSDMEKAAAKVGQIETLVQDLQDKIDLLPQETLKKLADILSKAAAEAEAKSGKP